METSKKNIKESIKKRFEYLHATLHRHEADLQARTDSLFINEKIKLHTLTRSSVDLSKTIENKLKKFNDTMPNPNIAKLVEEDYSNISKLIDEKLILPNDKFLQELEKLSKPFEKALPSENLLKDLDALKVLNKELDLLEAQSKIAQGLCHDSIAIQDVELEINIGIFSQVMNIQPSQVKRSFIFKKSQLKNVKGISYQIPPTQVIFNESVIHGISTLIKNLTSLESVSIELLNPLCLATIDTNTLQNLIATTFSHPETIKTIHIDVRNTVIGEQVPLFLIEKILPQIKDLRSFCFVSHNSGITNSTLKALTKEDFTKRQNLEKLRVNFSGAHLEDEEDIIQFLNRIPNVKDLSLGFGETTITEKCLESFTSNVLPSLDKVQRFEIELYKTNITDECVQKLLRNLPNVKNLLVGLKQTQITNASLTEFLETKISSMTNLKDLDLDISDTKISNDISDMIRNARQRIISSGFPSSGFFGKVPAFN